MLTFSLDLVFTKYRTKPPAIVFNAYIVRLAFVALFLFELFLN
jgi:hypothetical protein